MLKYLHMLINKLLNFYYLKLYIFIILIVKLKILCTRQLKLAFFRVWMDMGNGIIYGQKVNKSGKRTYLKYKNIQMLKIYKNICFWHLNKSINI